MVTALVTAAFWSVASAVATAAAGPQPASKALGAMMSGVGLATVVGLFHGLDQALRSARPGAMSAST